MHFEKATRIISDLIMYCHALGAEEYHMDLFHEETTYHIHISCPIHHADLDRVEELSETLNLPRQHEIEQTYWELSGESEIDSELTLIGMMVDEATVEYRDGLLHIHVIRKEQ